MAKIDRLLRYNEDEDYPADLFSFYCISTCCNKVTEHTLHMDNEGDAYDKNASADERILVQCEECGSTHYENRFVDE